MDKVFKGISGLVQSRKAMLCLIILACSMTGLMYGKLDSPSFAAIVATISTIYCWTSTKAKIKGMETNESSRENE